MTFIITDSIWDYNVNIDFNIFLFLTFTNVFFILVNIKLRKLFLPRYPLNGPELSTFLLFYWWTRTPQNYDSVTQ